MVVIEKADSQKRQSSIPNEKLDESEKESWKVQAENMQLNFLTELADRDFDELHCEDLEILEEKVYYALYKTPKEIALENNPDIKEEVDKVVAAILKEAGPIIYFSFIFVIGKPIKQSGSDDLIEEPVFKVIKNVHSETVFIDSSARIYKSWTTYLNNNVLPPCEYCYPCNGMYTFDEMNFTAHIDFAKSPSTKISKKILSALDKSATFVGLGCCAFTAVAPFSSALVAVGALGALYSSGRSIQRLIDKKNHGGNIGLTDSDARCEWIDIAANTITIGSSGASWNATKILRSGRELSKTASITMKGLIVGDKFIGGVRCLNLGYETYVESNRKEKFLKGLYFATECLMFRHTLFNKHKTEDLLTMSETIKQRMKNADTKTRLRNLRRRLAKKMSKQLENIGKSSFVMKPLKRIDPPKEADVTASHTSHINEIKSTFSGGSNVK